MGGGVQEGGVGNEKVLTKTFCQFFRVNDRHALVLVSPSAHSKHYDRAYVKYLMFTL